MASCKQCINQIRRLSLSSPMWVRYPKQKGRIPYDKRFGPTGKTVNPFKEGGNKYFPAYMGRPDKSGVSATGFYVDYPKVKQHFEVEKEMIPEFVVPDLTDFKLKPYVSYKVPDVVQDEFTAQNLFDAVYAKKIVDDFHASKIDPDAINVKDLVNNDKTS